MMGYQHALGGVALWLGAATVVDAAVTPLTGGQVALGAFLAAGGAMAPDLDQPGSTVSRTFGPFTNLLARLVDLLAGGHRWGTHSLMGLAATGALTWWAVDHAPWVTTWILLGIGLRGLRANGRHRWYSQVALTLFMALVALLVVLSGTPLVMLTVLAVLIGAVSHVGLDMLTPEGCPLFWLPKWLCALLRRAGSVGRAVAVVGRRRYGVGLVTTGSPRSSGLVTLGLTVLVAGLAYLALPGVA